MEYLQTAVELLAGFVALFFLTKLLGKTQITQITAFDFISALVLGELVGNALYDNQVHIGKVLFAISLWGLLIYALEWITQNFKGTRKFLEGEPSIVIKKGKINKNVLKKNKLDVNQLQHLVRSKDVFSLREVEYAILETDGSVSVLKKSEYDTPTKSDFNLPFQTVVLPVTLIIDGEIIWDNLKSCGFDRSWLMNQIMAFGAKTITDVMYAEWKADEGIHVITY